MSITTNTINKTTSNNNQVYCLYISNPQWSQLLEHILEDEYIYPYLINPDPQMVEYMETRGYDYELVTSFSECTSDKFHQQLYLLSLQGYQPIFISTDEDSDTLDILSYLKELIK